MAKGIKRREWLLQTIRLSKKQNKKMWNRKVRRIMNLSDHCFYKKLAGDSMFDMIP